MHSKIFQITKVKAAKKNWLNENTLEQGGGYYYDYDYCSEIGDDERRRHIADLVDNVLPKGMFDLVEDNVIRYNGGAGKWIEDFVQDIKNMAEVVTTENCMWWGGGVYRLERFLKNPLDTDYHFYMDEQGIYGFAERSYEFMRMVSQLEPGALLYIGGVIDYHF